MNRGFSFVVVAVLTIASADLNLFANHHGYSEAPRMRGEGVAAAQTAQQEVVKQLMARERASYEAWQKKDKAFWNDYLTDDSTYFGPDSPYMEVDPKVNFVPKFEQYAEVFKILDFQIYNPHVQVYGDVAILTYNLAQAQSVSGRLTTSTGKVSRVYIKQGGTWRVVHTHESTNPKVQ